MFVLRGRHGIGCAMISSFSPEVLSRIRDLEACLRDPPKKAMSFIRSWILSYFIPGLFFQESFDFQKLASVACARPPSELPMFFLSRAL